MPDHKVRESQLEGTARVEVGGEVIAESDDVIRVDEDGSPPRLYFPRSGVSMSRLLPARTTSHCPFKGDARYFDIKGGGHLLRDAVWSYEQPYEEHQALAERVAFYDEKHPEIRITTG